VSKLVPIYFTKIHTLPGIEGKIILKWKFRIGRGGREIDWIDQAQASNR
jgi:hypothetical protein